MQRCWCHRENGSMLCIRMAEVLKLHPQSEVSEILM